MTELWSHQQEAVDFARDRRGTMLNMWMGTGKTLVAIKLLEEWESNRTLVLAPVSVVTNWRAEVKKHANGALLDVAAMPGGATPKKIKELERLLARNKNHGRRVVFVTNYESMRAPTFRKAVVKGKWDTLICDEIHRLKSPTGSTARHVAALADKTPHRLGLTGTVMPHSPMDPWAQYRLLDKSIFGPWFARYRNTYARVGVQGDVECKECGHRWVPSQHKRARVTEVNDRGVLRQRCPVCPGVAIFHVRAISGFKNLDDLAERMATATFSCGKDVLDLPPEMDVRIEVDLGRDARKAYDELEELLRTQVQAGEVKASNALVKLLRLQQITSGLVAVDDGDEFDPKTRTIRIDDAKQKALRDLVEDLGDEPLVVFSRFHGDLDAAHEVCKDLDTTSAELSGRNKELSLWQAGDARVLATQEQAGGVGVDMTRAAYCAFYSLSWSLGDFDQARARVHRPGQTRKTTYYHLVARNTVDEAIYRAITNKQHIVDSVLRDLAKGKK
jgi:SNF2 family DNA or RNA helicase